MKIIFKIARAEFRNLFFSPVAWFVVLVFYVFCALIFFTVNSRLTLLQEMVIESQPGWTGFEGLTNSLMMMVIPQFLNYTYMFIPLLTMGLMNREVTSGTIKLLYSSPIRSREIVLGKYLGMVWFNFLLLLSVGLVLSIASLTINNAEHNWHLAIMFALFLLINAYTAIGLFISCLTNYQIVAAVVTFAVFFVMGSLSGLWQDYDIIGDITYAFSMGGRAEKMIGGLISTREVIYFIVIILMFLGFSLVKIKSTQESKKWTVAFFRYSLVLVVAVLIGYLSSRPGYIGYYDAMKNKTNTLHPVVQDEVRKLDGSPVVVTLYTNLLHANVTVGLKRFRNDYFNNFWERFIRFYPNLQFRYEYYYGVNEGDSSWYKKYPGKTLEEIADLQAEVMGARRADYKKASEMDNYEELKSQYLKVIMQLEYKGKKAWLRLYEDTYIWPHQNHVAATLSRLTRTKDYHVGFLTGHYERSPNNATRRDYGIHFNIWKDRNAFINLGVDSDTLNAWKPVPDSVDMLMVADPRSAYDQAELDHIDQYIQQGRNAVILVEPAKKGILKPVLDKLGIQIEDGIIVRPDKHEMPHISLNSFTDTGNWMSKEKAMEYFQLYRLPGAVANNEGAANISYTEINGFRVEPVLFQRGNEGTWVENGVLVVDSAAPVFNPAENDYRKDRYVTAVKLTRKINNREQRIVVASDADFMSIPRMSHSSHGLALYSWALDNKYPIYVNFRQSEDRLFRIGSKTAKALYNIFVYGISGLLLISAIILLIRRKRK
ncbi:MAG: Gldg family protein [Pseudobacter sp.]|uniref:Gldg family protein n=1 Tax=Pseudobacter sp. TaxID=2045420 RepID=UPI003F7E966E